MGEGLTLYLDASALVKRYVREPGSDEIATAMDDADRVIASQLTLVEALIAVAKGEGTAVRKLREDWKLAWVIDVDEALCERAAELGIKRGLRTLDAVHLASARLIDDEFAFATWDRRLHAAARAEGFATLPESLA